MWWIAPQRDAPGVPAFGHWRKRPKEAGDSPQPAGVVQLTDIEALSKWPLVPIQHDPAKANYAMAFVNSAGKLERSAALAQLEPAD